MKKTFIILFYGLFLFISACVTETETQATRMDPVDTDAKTGAMDESKLIYRPAPTTTNKSDGQIWFESQEWNVVYRCTDSECSIVIEHPDGSPFECPEEVQCRHKSTNYDFLELQHISTPGLKNLIYGVNAISPTPAYFFSGVNLFNFETGNIQTLLEFPPQTTLILNDWSPDLNRLAVVAGNYNDPGFPNTTLLYILNFSEGGQFTDYNIFDIAILQDPSDWPMSHPMNVRWISNEEVGYYTPATSGNIQFVEMKLNISTGKLSEVE